MVSQHRLPTTKACPGMNSRIDNCTNSDQWHQDLLEGCHDIVDRLSHIIDVLKSSQVLDVPKSRRLRLVLETDDTTHQQNHRISTSESGR